jgi:hypothetical protein
MSAGRIIAILCGIRTKIFFRSYLDKRAFAREVRRAECNGHNQLKLNLLKLANNLIKTNSNLTVELTFSHWLAQINASSAIDINLCCMIIVRGPLVRYEKIMREGKIASS